IEAREAKYTIIAQAKETAQHAADRLVENAKIAINNEKAAAMTDLKNQVAQLSIDVAEKVLKKELSDKPAQEALAKEIINQAKLN
ncbi:MAG: F0F1 ATP synthase subunit B, partial [Weeksellaceae bacterium]|nr:F0F1 ATP synthase subunit B [Weeksellaceae bacterium]